jgi:hypothetical protein
MAPPPPWRNSKNPAKLRFFSPTWRSIRVGIPKSIRQSGEVFGFGDVPVDVEIGGQALLTLSL